MYGISFYWTIQTISTVGYGDIGIGNNAERLFCVFAMVLGVIAFGIANGQITSIISNFDSKNALYAEKLEVLNHIYKDYELPLELYNKLKKTIGYEAKKELTDVNDFVASLPHKLKIEASLYIYEKRYNQIKFFRNQSSSFIAWMCPLLKPFQFETQ